MKNLHEAVVEMQRQVKLPETQRALARMCRAVERLGAREVMIQFSKMPFAPAKFALSLEDMLNRVDSPERAIECVAILDWSLRELRYGPKFADTQVEEEMLRDLVCAMLTVVLIASVGFIVRHESYEDVFLGQVPS